MGVWLLPRWPASFEPLAHLDKPCLNLSLLHQIAAVPDHLLGELLGKPLLVTERRDWLLPTPVPPTARHASDEDVL